jgi:hypothetical protein
MNPFKVSCGMFLFLSLFGCSAWADDAVLTQMEGGGVQIFSNPSKKVDGPSPRALYEGEYYTVRDAKVGDALASGNVIRTSATSKARVVYANGDQMQLAPGSSYRIFLTRNKKELELKYGRIRAILANGGPRKGLKLKTKSATMGVRGTDFVLGEAEVSVLRGTIEVQTKGGAKPKTVKDGESADIVAEPKSASVSTQIRKTTQQELIEIQKVSTLSPASEVPADIKDKIETLERKATEMVLKDIQKADPELHAQLQGAQSAADLNKATVGKVFQAAPTATKPGLQELEAIEPDAYRKYFKIGE